MAMATTGPRPADPDTEAGLQALQDQVILELTNRPSPPDVANDTVKMMVADFQRANRARIENITVRDVAHHLDVANMEFTQTHGQSQLEKFNMAVLEALQSEQYVAGQHYIGEILKTKAGRPRKCVANFEIEVTQQGAFGLYGTLAADRVAFLSCAWTVHELVVQEYGRMKDALREYDRELKETKEERCAEMEELIDTLVAAYNFEGQAHNPRSVASCALAHKHKEMYKQLFFRNMTATDAMRFAGLIRAKQKAGVVHRQFSPHGQLCDKLRLSSITQSLIHKMAEIEATEDLATRKAMVAEAVNRVIEHFAGHNGFDFPWLSREEQVTMMFSRFPKRARIAAVA